MLAKLAEYSLVVILLAVMVEELGIPMPIPTDVLIVFIGAVAATSVLQLGQFFIMLSVVSAIGASGLYAIVRHSGRPLVERFGRYVHLGPKQLARSEALLARGGWKAIALGRATPGLRYPTVIACGLFRISYPRFISAHLVGSAVYIAVFLILGRVFGPAVLSWLHLPELGKQLLWLLLLAVGLPLLVVFVGLRAHPRQPAHPSRRRSAGAVLLGSFAGATALTATWTMIDTVAALLLREAHPFLDPVGLAREFGGGAYLLIYAALLLVLIGVGAAYHGLLLPPLEWRHVSLLRQTLGLTLFALGVFGVIFVSTFVVVGYASFELWWQTGGLMVLLGDVLGVGTYALITVYGRVLAIALAPSLSRPSSN
jgi:membrane protein DedA with SNARE-associated domain